MTPRWKPTIGIVGVDFGYKPAISLVVPPMINLMRQVPDDEPVCRNVASYDITLADTVICTDCISSTVSGAPFGGSITWDAGTVAGLFTLNGGTSSPSLGAWTFSLSGADDLRFTWYSPNLDCTGDNAPGQSSEPLLQLICSNARLSFRIFSTAGTSESGQYHYFFLANSVRPGVAFSNELTSCAAATVGLDLFFPSRKVITAATGGTGMIS